MMSKLELAAADACDRLRGQLHNSARRQYFRITRAEAEALAALPIPTNKDHYTQPESRNQ